jgi:hypothetical protein
VIGGAFVPRQDLLFLILYFSYFCEFLEAIKLVILLGISFCIICAVAHSSNPACPKRAIVSAKV